MYKLWDKTRMEVINQSNDFFELLSQMNRLIVLGIGQDVQYDITK